MKQEEKILFLIKFGKKSHLEQIVEGKIRFSPSSTYRRIENEMKKRGQGDALEGKMVIHASSGIIRDYETNEPLKIITEPFDSLLGIQNIENMPIFCLSCYCEEDVEICENESSMIKLDKSHVKRQMKDFPESDYALIILEPEIFIDDINNIMGHTFVHDRIHYFDYGINSLQMLMYLTLGDESIPDNIGNMKLSMVEDNAYRHLLCKDNFFSKQNEYRFIERNYFISEPVSYNFNFHSKYLLVPIESLIEGVKIM